MGIYENAASTALRLLSKFGQDVLLRKFSPGAYANGVLTATQTSYSIKGAVFDYPRMNFGETLQNGTLVSGADRNLFLAANSVRPEVDDRVILANGNEWNIVEIKPLGPAGTPVCYDCRIRQ